MKKLIIFLLLCVPMLCSCSGNEPNDVAYVVALGIDKGSGDNFDITIQFAKPNTISGGASEEGGKAGNEIIENIFIEAPSIYSAINVANSVISKEFSLSHTRIIVFSEELAREGIGDLLQTFAKSDDIRPDILLAVSKDKASEYLKNIKPLVELNPIKYYQLIYEKNNFGTIPKINASEVYFDIISGLRDPVMPLAGVMKAPGGDEEGSSSQQASGDSGGSSGGSSGGGSGSSGGEESGQENQTDLSQSQQELNQENEIGTNQEGFQYKIKDYQAGEVAIIESDKSEALGMAVFRSDKLEAIFGETESEIYNILNGTYDSSFVTFSGISDKAFTVTVKLHQYRRPSYKVNIKDKTVNIKLYLEFDIYSFDENDKIDQNTSEFEHHCEEIMNSEFENFIKKMRDNYGSDIMGIGEKAKKCFWSLKSYNEYDWENQFPDYEISVDTELKTRHSGLTAKEES